MKTDPVADQLLYAVPQAARVLSLSPRLLWSFIHSGELKVRHVGTRTLIPRRELEKFAGRDHSTPKIEKEPQTAQ
jgi:excisionase family DNA binding protein